MATHYIALQHTATHCNTLQHTAMHVECHSTHCNTLQHTAPLCVIVCCLSVGILVDFLQDRLQLSTDLSVSTFLSVSLFLCLSRSVSSAAHI